jgi:hypothetical protein
MPSGVELFDVRRFDRNVGPKVDPRTEIFGSAVAPRPGALLHIGAHDAFEKLAALVQRSNPALLVEAVRVRLIGAPSRDSAFNW